jgi:hypothetical protein
MPSTNSLFGEIAIQLKLLSRAQVAEALHLQLAEGESRQLGQICVDLGLLRPAQVKFILEQQKRLIARRGKGADALPGAPVAAGSHEPGQRRRPKTIHELPSVRGGTGEQAVPPTQSSEPKGSTVEQLLRDYVAGDSDDTAMARQPDRAGAAAPSSAAGRRAAAEGPPRPQASRGRNDASPPAVGAVAEARSAAGAAPSSLPGAGPRARGAEPPPAPTEPAPPAAGPADGVPVASPP